MYLLLIAAVLHYRYFVACDGHNVQVIDQKGRMLTLLVVLVVIAAASAYRSPQGRLTRSKLFQSIQVCAENELMNNNRMVVDTSEGAVVVTKIMDKYFAVNAKCPHLGSFIIF